jgi:hypothetical protein
MLPPLPRLPEVKGLIDGEQYFVLHAPRQSGKTTTIMAFVDKINEDGSYYALYCSLERLRSITDEDRSMNVLASALNMALEDSKVDALRKAVNPSFWEPLAAKFAFKTSPAAVCLKALSAELDKDLVVFFDEVDTLTEGPLMSFLSQLRLGYIGRAEAPFPRSIALVGMRNIRDFKIKIRPESESIGSTSPFNIVAEALTLPNFTQKEVEALYAQHTEATGQVFANDAVQRAYYWSEGQPWLVNALARQVVEKILANDYRPAIEAELIDQAADNLMKRRDTHIDSLLERLKEPRVKRFVEPMLAAALEATSEDGSESLSNDLQYCYDLGLLKTANGLICPANPIYASVISRFINEDVQINLPNDLIGKWMDKTTIDMNGLLKAFQKFWSESADRYLKGVRYIEAAPHIVLTAFLQRVVNGGAALQEEYALGLGRVDILVKYAGINYPIELKIKDNQTNKADSLDQILGYMNRSLAKQGWLVIFDRKSHKTWAKKLTWETKNAPDDQIIHVVGC